MLLIGVFRTIFVVYYYDKLQVAPEPLKEIFLAYFHAIALDVATASILIAVPWLLIAVNSLFKSKLIQFVLLSYTSVVVTLASFIYIAELGVYNEWDEKPTFKIFNYLTRPEEILNSNPLVYTIILSVILVVVLSVFYKLTHSLHKGYELSKSRNFLVSFLFFILSPAVILLGARGGVDVFPISQSSAYFSKHQVYNDVAISTVYNFIHSVTENYSAMNGENGFKIEMDESEKEEILKEYMATDANCNYPSVLTTNRPNVVLVIWESLSGDFLEDAKYREVIPNFMKMAEEGILFNEAYASATLSHEGLPAIFSAWPALYDTYITNLPSKFNKLPTITEKLNDVGYNSMFLFGGQLIYGNMTSYVFSNDFDVLEEGKDIDLDVEKGKIGIHDEDMFKYFTQKTNELKEPFFSSLYTLTSHSPYDQPMEDVFEWGGSDNGYINSIHYTDKTVGEFMKEARKESWYENTLFIFVPDHSHRSPKGWARTDARWHKIPMLFYGDVIKEEYRGLKYEKVVSQEDLAATLLAQLSVGSEEFVWSRNVFCEDYKQNAYVMVKNGFGFVEKNSSLSYDLKENRILHGDANVSSLKTKGNVYMEKLLQTYLDY